MDEILYGQKDTPNIVSIEELDNNIIIYQQDDAYNVSYKVHNRYKPFIYTHDDENPNCNGSNYYNKISTLNSIETYKRLKTDRDQYIKIHDIPSLYMMNYGFTLYKGMGFDDINTMGFDIETTGLDPYKCELDIDKIDGKMCPYKLKSEYHTIIDIAKTIKIVSPQLIITHYKLEKKKVPDEGLLIKFFMILADRGCVLVDHGDKVKSISMKCNLRTDFEEFLYEKDDEAKLINDFITNFNIVDPSILLGYNSYNFDIPFLLYRSKLHGIKLNMGRNGTEPYTSQITVRLGTGKNERVSSYKIFGRQCIDLYYIVMKFDATSRQLENYKLKTVMSVYGLEKPDRLVLTNDEIQEGLEAGEGTEAFEKVKVYNIDDSDDLLALHRHTAQADFYITQMLPFNYDTLVYLGNVGRINGLLIRGYLKNEHSIPKFTTHLNDNEIKEGEWITSVSEEYTNELYPCLNSKKTDRCKLEILRVNDNNTIDALDLKEKNVWTLPLDKLQTDIKIYIEGAKVLSNPGVYENVGDSDVSSMYPSIQLEYGIFSDTDELHLMEYCLSRLRAMRFEYKSSASIEEKTNGVTRTYHELNGKQLAFKVLLNSFFGALSSNGFHWKQANKGAEITRHGRKMILNIKDHVEERGFALVALDTDGLSYTNGEKFDVKEMNDSIESILSSEIGMETQIFSHQIVFARKTYYAVKDNGKVMIKGAALTSRGMSSYIRRFFKQMCNLLCTRDYDGIKQLYKYTINSMSNNEFPIEDFQETKGVNKTIEQYQKHKKTTEPLYELAIRTNQEMNIGDKKNLYHTYIINEKGKRETQLNWVDNFNNDLDVEYYLNLFNEKLKTLLIKKYDKKKDANVGILTENTFYYIFDEMFDKLENTHLYRFYYSTGVYHNGDKTGMSKWDLIDKRTYFDTVKSGDTDKFITIQSFRDDFNDYDPTYCPLYFDFDSSDLNESFVDARNVYMYFKNVLNIDDKYIMAYFSGNKGFHIEINAKVFGYKPRCNIQLINKFIALDLIKQYNTKTMDIGSIYSKRRMWRVPLSIHGKTGIRKTYIPEFDKYDEFDICKSYIDAHQDLETEYKIWYQAIIDQHNCEVIDSLSNWYNEYKDIYLNKLQIESIRKPEYKYKLLKGKLPKCIDYLLRMGITQSGQRNPATMALGSFFKEFGMEKEQVLEEILQWSLKIPSNLTSTTNESDLRRNISTILNTIYNVSKYSFQCYYIIPLLRGHNFSCPSNCKLLD